MYVCIIIYIYIYIYICIHIYVSHIIATPVEDATEKGHREEIKSRLRELGQPATLFGETLDIVV